MRTEVATVAGELEEPPIGGTGRVSSRIGQRNRATDVWADGLVDFRRVCREVVERSSEARGETALRLGEAGDRAMPCGTVKSSVIGVTRETCHSLRHCIIQEITLNIIHTFMKFNNNVSRYSGHKGTHGDQGAVPQAARGVNAAGQVARLPDTGYCQLRIYPGCSGSSRSRHTRPRSRLHPAATVSVAPVRCQ